MVHGRDAHGWVHLDLMVNPDPHRLFGLGFNSNELNLLDPTLGSTQNSFFARLTDSVILPT